MAPSPVLPSSTAFITAVPTIVATTGVDVDSVVDSSTESPRCLPIRAWVSAPTAISPGPAGARPAVMTGWMSPALPGTSSNAIVQAESPSMSSPLPDSTLAAETPGSAAT